MTWTRVAARIDEAPRKPPILAASQGFAAGDSATGRSRLPDVRRRKALMRDKRFVAAHRGGPLTLTEHRLLAAWAADCAEHLLPLFERHCSDSRPRLAIEVGRAWVRGELKTGVAQRATVAAHAAAREATDMAAVAVARAAGHAVATAHFADHSLGPVIYGAKAVEAAGGSANDEHAWQLTRLPDEVRALVISALERRRTKSCT